MKAGEVYSPEVVIGAPVAEAELYGSFCYYDDAAGAAVVTYGDGNPSQVVGGCCPV